MVNLRQKPIDYSVTASKEKRWITEDRLLAAFFIAIAIGMTVGFIYFEFYAPPDPTTFQRQDAYIQECLASEQYTRDECIQMSVVEFDAR